MLLIEVSYFFTFLTLLSLVVCQLRPGIYHITNTAINTPFGREILVASASSPGSKVVIDRINDDKFDLQVWNFRAIEGGDAFNIVLQRYNLYLSVVNNQVVTSLNPFSWKVSRAEDNRYMLSLTNDPIFSDNLNVETSSGIPQVGLTKARDSNTREWIFERVIDN